MCHFEEAIATEKPYLSPVSQLMKFFTRKNYRGSK